MPVSGLADEITIAADEWCPYNCTPGTATPGFMIEIAEKVFQKAGHTVKYDIVAWDQALEATREGKINAVAGAAKEDAPDFVFPRNAIGKVSNNFFTRKDSSWTYAGIGSLKGVKVGITDGYVYEPELDKYFADNKDTPAVYAASGDLPLEKLVEKLMNGEIDVVVEDRSVFTYFFTSRGIIDMLAQCRDAGPTGPADELYIAFSPANPKSEAYARTLSDGVDALRKSGELKELLAKYGDRDWK